MTADVGVPPTVPGNFESGQRLRLFSFRSSSVTAANYTKTVQLLASLDMCPAAAPQQALRLPSLWWHDQFLLHATCQPMQPMQPAVPITKRAAFHVLGLAIAGQGKCWFVQQYEALRLWMFHRRTHQSLASVGVAALVRLVTSAGSQMSSSIWQETVDMVAQAAAHTVPQVAELVSPPPRYHPHALLTFTFRDYLYSHRSQNAVTYSVLPSCHSKPMCSVMFILYAY